MTDDPYTTSRTARTSNSVSGQARIGHLVQADSIESLTVHQGAPLPPIPRQLRPEVAHFVDREGEQERFARSVRARRGAEGRPLVVAVSGLSGVGKTTLGFRLARAFADAADDAGHGCGALYVDLDPLRHDGVVEPADALAELLGPLGIAPEWLGATQEARAKQYWERTHGTRLVVVVDNARYGAEVEPLLPASGDSVVIVASQGRLYDLDDADAVELPLRPLPQPDAVRLLGAIAGAARLAGEPEAVAALASLCDGLPAALRVAAGRVRRHRRRPVSRLVAEFGAELREKGVPVVEAVWDAAYRDLSERACGLYELLGAFGIPVPLAALPSEDAEDAVEELEEAGLVDVRDERLTMHALVRAHAERRARDRDPARVRAACTRLVRWYLRQAQYADRVAAGARLVLGAPEPPLPDLADVELADSGAAYAWLESERHALLRCVHLAYADGFDDVAWALCEPLWTHHLDRPRHADTVAAFRTGLAAARRAEHLAATVRLRCQLARPLWETGAFDEAARELDAAVAAAVLLPTTPDGRKLAASAREFRGRLQAERGAWEAALPDYEAARAVHEEIGNAYGVMLLTYQLGRAEAHLGHRDRARDLLEQAHAEARRLGRDRMTARTALALGQVLEQSEEPARAGELYASALASARARGSAFEEARVLDALARLARTTADAAAADAYEASAAALRARYGAAGS
ncbi:hypothetical protein AB0J38_15075 [Streptomyces sp. NPDC050095]|uniref:hypothetical protein n=1 Tax=unclassified Streptomyces TaxID=2593676 RepID=UPI0034201E18